MVTQSGCMCAGILLPRAKLGTYSTYVYYTRKLHYWNGKVGYNWSIDYNKITNIS